MAHSRGSALNSPAHGLEAVVNEPRGKQGVTKYDIFCPRHSIFLLAPLRPSPIALTVGGAQTGWHGIFAPFNYCRPPPPPPLICRVLRSRSGISLLFGGKSNKIPKKKRKIAGRSRDTPARRGLKIASRINRMMTNVDLLASS